MLSSILCSVSKKNNKKLSVIQQIRKLNFNRTLSPYKWVISDPVHHNGKSGSSKEGQKTAKYVTRLQ